MIGQFQNGCWRAAAFVCSFLLMGLGLSAHANEPYTAIVTVDKAELLSMPGKQSYVTHFLAEGMEVEVYKQSEEGWLGIRPPEGSFSWIDAEHIQMTDEPGVGEVIKEGAPSWVGSAAETIARHQSQVKLPAGTQVEVLGKKRIATANGESQIWLKIAPPAGEFRWIHAGEVRRLHSPAPTLARNKPTPAKRPKEVGSGVRTPLTPAPEEALANERETDVVSGEEGDGSDVELASAEEEVGGKTRASKRGSRSVKAKSPPVRMAETLERLRDLGESLSEDSQALHEPGRFAPAGEAMPLESIDEPEVKKQPTVNSILANQVKSAEGALEEQPEEEMGAVQTTAGVNDGPPNNAQVASPAGDGFVPRKRRTNEPLSTGGRPAEIAVRPGVKDSLGGSKSLKGSSGVDSSSSERIARNTPEGVRTAENRNLREPLLSGGVTGSTKEKLDQIEVELSLMLSRPKESWNLSALQRRTESIIDTGASPADRGQARMLLDKIKQFQTAFDVPAPSIAPTSKRGGVEYAKGPANNSPHYDYTGWLKPVFSREPGAAPYAIYDAEGHRLTFVSPAPGLNLTRFIDKEVGLYGKRGYIEALATPHLTAEKVIDLERHRR